MCRARRARRPGAPCPWRVAAGRRPAPRRPAVSIAPPTPPTCGAGTSAPGGARGPRPACHCGPARAPYPPRLGVPRQRRRVPGVRHRPRGGVAPRPLQPLARRPTTGRREASGRGARACAKSARAGKVTRRGATRACPRRAWGALPPSSVGRAPALLRASMRLWMRSAARPSWAWKPCARVVRRARGAAVSVGQGRRTAPKIAVSFSCNHCRTWGKALGRVLGKRVVRRTVSPPRRWRCATRGAQARSGGLGGERGLGGGIVGMARGKRVAVLRQGARREGKAHAAIRGAQRGHDRPVLECQAHRAGLAVAARAPGLAPRSDRLGAVGEHEPLPSLRASSLAAHLVFGSRPGEAHQGRPGFEGVLLHG